MTNLEDRLLNIDKLEDVNPENIRRMYKLKTMLDFMEAKDQNKKLSQKEICSKLGISKSTLYRTRRDLDMGSLNRYDVPVTSEAQRKKDKVRRTVTSLHKQGLIDASERDSLRSIINENNLESAVKKIRDITSSFPETSKSGSHRRSTQTLSQKSNPRGGTLTSTESDGDEINTITENEAHRKIQKHESLTKAMENLKRSGKQQSNNEYNPTVEELTKMI